MTAIDDTPPTPPTATVAVATAPPEIGQGGARSSWWSLLPGAGLSLAVAVAATAAGRVVPVIGGPVFGLVIGIAFAALARPGARFAPGVSFSGRYVLQASIVALGATLSIHQVAATGIASLPVMLPTLALSLAMAYVAGRILRINGNLRTMIGVGTAICGGSAIAAVTAVLGAAEIDVAYAISTIFAFNVVAVLAYPTIGHLLHLSQHAFGLWAGTAINDTSSVVAAALVYGKAAGANAVVVKLTRSLAIVPISIALAAWKGRAATRATGAARPGLGSTVRRALPWFIVWFLAVVVANSFGLVPAVLSHDVSAAAPFLITVALAAIGLSVRLGDFRRSGPRPLLLGAVLWATVGVSSLVLQALFFRLHG